MCVRLTGCVGSSLLAVGVFAFSKLTWSWSVCCVVCVRLTGCVGSSLLAVGVFAFSKLTWSWSVSAEVFGLNNLFTALLMSRVVDIDVLTPEQYQQIPQVSLPALFSFISSVDLCV